MKALPDRVCVSVWWPSNGNLLMNNEAALQQCVSELFNCVCTSLRVCVREVQSALKCTHTDAHAWAFFNLSSEVAKMLVLRRGIVCGGVVFRQPKRMPMPCPCWPLVNFFVSFPAPCTGLFVVLLRAAFPRILRSSFCFLCECPHSSTFLPPMHWQ